MGLWDNVNALAGLDEMAAHSPAAGIQARRRRGYTSEMRDGRASLLLVNDDGMRRWVYQPPARERSGRRAGRAPLVNGSDVLQTFRFPDKGPNQVTQSLLALDRSLTPNQGLRRWDGQTLVAVDAPRLEGRTLLFVHGTFSKSDMYLEELGATQPGRDLLNQLRARYGENILFFDHPTLSVGPWINALYLHKAVQNVTGPIDVVCHSRGGLVVSWWLRLAPSLVREVVFVGSPLDGTSLASPASLRGALDHIATVADILGHAGEAASAFVPLAAGAAGLAKIFGRVLKLGAQLPVIDAAVGLVPGLAAQQRTSNNIESAALFADAWLGHARFSAITAEFAPSTEAPLWHVWTQLKALGAKAVAGAADLVFDGANDLVVDTSSMSYLGPRLALENARRHDLGGGQYISHKLLQRSQGGGCSGRFAGRMTTAHEAAGLIRVPRALQTAPPCNPIDIPNQR